MDTFVFVNLSPASRQIEGAQRDFCICFFLIAFSLTALIPSKRILRWHILVSYSRLLEASCTVNHSESWRSSEIEVIEISLHL
jgi:hypothetical protein